MGRIAITGASSFLGARFLRRLIRDGHGDDIVVIDVAAPPLAEGSVLFRKVDLTEPAADQAMLDLLKADGIETLVHLAFFTSPRRDTTNAHELESIGTLAVLALALLWSARPARAARGRPPLLATVTVLTALMTAGLLVGTVDSQTWGAKAQVATGFAGDVVTVGIGVLSFVAIARPVGQANEVARLHGLAVERDVLHQPAAEALG